MDSFKFADLPRGAENVLLVDANPTVLKICRLLLESLGYRVTALNCPKAALNNFTSAPDRYDLVITEMDLHPLTGDKLIASLAKVRPTVPAIAHTARLAPAYRGAFHGLVRKPASFMEMATAIRQALDGNGTPPTMPE